MPTWRTSTAKRVDAPEMKSVRSEGGRAVVMTMMLPTRGAPKKCPAGPSKTYYEAVPSRVPDGHGTFKIETLHEAAYHPDAFVVVQYGKVNYGDS